MNLVLTENFLYCYSHRSIRPFHAKSKSPPRASASAGQRANNNNNNKYERGPPPQVTNSCFAATATNNNPPPGTMPMPIMTMTLPWIPADPEHGAGVLARTRMGSTAYDVASSGAAAYDVASSGAVRGYLLPRQLQAETRMGVIGEGADQTGLAAAVAPPPPIMNGGNNHNGMGTMPRDVAAGMASHDPVATLMMPPNGDPVAALMMPPNPSDASSAAGGFGRRDDASRDVCQRRRRHAPDAAAAGRGQSILGFGNDDDAAAVGAIRDPAVASVEQPPRQRRAGAGNRLHASAAGERLQ